jgi:hypothetical protein
MTGGPHDRTDQIPALSRPSMPRAHCMAWVVKRRDPTKPGFWYLNFHHPNPPLVPPQSYVGLYSDTLVDPPYVGSWMDVGVTEFDAHLRTHVPDNERRTRLSHTHHAKIRRWVEIGQSDHAPLLATGKKISRWRPTTPNCPSRHRRIPISLDGSPQSNETSPTDQKPLPPDQFARYSSGLTPNWND